MFEDLLIFTFKLSILPFIVTLIYCFKQKKVTTKIYLYLFILMLLNITILYTPGITLFLVDKWLKIDTSALDIVLLVITQIFLAPAAVIHILKKYFSCQEPLAYTLFILFNLSLCPYIVATDVILGIYTTTSLGYPL